MTVKKLSPLRQRALRPAAAALLALVVTLGLGACDPTPDDAGTQPIVIAGGGTTGVYHQYGSQLAQVLSRDLDRQFEVAETAGSVDNLLRIGSGEALLGFAQSDAAASAVEGNGAFDRPLAIRAIARLYDEYVHVVVRRDSDIEDLGDFVGRTVSLGAKNSGVNLVAMRVLEAANVDPASVLNVGLGPDASIEALRAGQIDGFFWVGGVPTPGLAKLSTDTPIRLLSIGPETVEALNSAHSGAYRISEFPLGSYGWETPTVTMTVPNYLVVSESASPELVRSVTETLFASRTELAQQVPAAALLDRRQAIFTDPIELHPGAISYYVETKR
ncbi:MAG: TAXI family TRAP transporter solute-binding subunit [Actinobacteria bacterium]|nr:TAXI family TRAP transporter solute-binding subunit [Actinomycetota bacterium]